MREIYAIDRVSRALLVFGILCLPAATVAQDEGEWFYLVKTEPSDPAREAEFNAWYDDIDIPDVLGVPSFRRARRAVAEEAPGFPAVRLKSDDGKYAALYDIATSDIDKSIIDLYVAARKMSALGRLTDVLKVVEANYYRRLEAHDLEKTTIKRKHDFIYIQKIVCCADDASRTVYRNWLDDEYVPALRGVNGLARVCFYELYRIMEELAVGPDEIPHLLLVHEITADSANDAMSGIQAAAEKLALDGRASDLHEIRDSILYRQMSDIRSD